MRHEPSIPESGHAERAPGRGAAAPASVHAIDPAGGEPVRRSGLTSWVLRWLQVARSWPLWRRLALGGIVAAAAVALRLSLDDPLTDQHLYATLLPAVAIAAVLGRRAAGLLVMGLAAALTHVFVAPLVLVTDLLTLAAFVMGSLVIVAAAGVLHAALDELEERKAADASTAAQSQLAAIIESTSDAVIGFDTTGHIFSWNPAAERLFGYTADEAIGRDAGLLGAPVDHSPPGETLRDLFDRALAGELVSRDTRRVAKDGTVLDVALTSAQIRNHAGRVLGVSTIIRDISARRRSELALQQSEDRLQRFVADAPAAIAMLDRGMNYIAASREWVEAYDLDPANFIGRFHYELHPDLPPHYKDVHRRALAGEVVRAEEEFLPLRDGTLRFVRWEVRPWHEADGRVGGIVILSDDVTARVEMVRELRESRQDLARAQAVGRIGSWRLDVRRNELRWSEENHRIFGVPPGTPMTYESFLDIVHPDDRAPVHKAWADALSGEPYDIEHRIVVDGAIRWVRERAELEFDKGGRLLGGFGTTQDVTEKKEAEARLAERETQLRFALSGAHAAAWRWNIRTGEQQWSPEGYVLHGRDPALGSPSYADWMSCLHPDDRVPLEDVLARAARQSDPSFRSEYRVVLPSGEVRWLASLGRIEFGADGAAVSMSGINLDVSERRRTQEALALAKQQLDAHIDNSPLAVIEFDREFRVVRWSAGAERLFGWSSADMCGRQVAEVRWIFEADHDAVYELMESMKSSARSRTVCINRNYRKDGSIADCQWYNSAVHDAEGNLVSVLSSVLDVTERNRAERELRKSEERLRLALAGANAGVWDWEPASGRVAWSPECFEIFGLDASAGIPRYTDWLGLVHEDDRQRVAAVLEDLIEGSTLHYELEHRIRNPRKGVRWLSSPGRVERDEAGRARRLVGLNIDITARKEAEAALAASEARLAGLISSALDGIISIDSDERIRLFNPAAERLFGYRADDILGQPLDVLIPKRPRVSGAFDAGAADAQGTEAPPASPDREVIAVRANGEEFWAEMSISRALLGDAFVYTAVVRDVTERKRSEAALRQSEERLRMSTEAGGIGTFTIDVPTGNAEFSPETSVMVGFPAMSGAPISDVFARVHHDDLDMVRQRYEAALDPLQGGDLRVELRFVQPGGAIRWMTWSGRVEFTEENSARRPLRLLGVCADTTERRQVLEELRLAKEDLERRVAERTAELQDAMRRRQEAQEALAHSQRLEALGRLAGGLTHDFNNTLAAIGAHIELAAVRTTDELARDYLGKALDAVETSAGLNLRLLSFTRRKALPREVVDTREVLANSVEMVRRTIDGGITLTAEIDDDLWPTIIDVSELQSAMLNLAINACDAMSDNGTLGIRIENAVVGASPDDAQVEGNPASGGQFVRVVVADDGEGMSPEVLARAGEPFFTTKSVSKGTGLGLNSVREFVRAIGGFMTIRSQLGKGTVVAIYLPSAVGQQPQHHLPADRSIVSLGDGETVLLVEDDERVLEATHALIEGLGYAVIDARSGEEALRLLATDAHVAVVLSDVVMPGQISGYDVARTVKRDYPRVGMVLASGYDAEEQRGSQAVPGVRSLRKPFTRAAVAEALRKAMAPG